MRLLRQLYRDDAGFVLHVELLFILTILVIGTVTALVALRQAVIAEAVEIANAILALNDSFSFSGQTNCESSSAGSAAANARSLTPLVVMRVTQGSVAPAMVSTITQKPCE
jgi:hypothetical protein